MRLLLQEDPAVLPVKRHPVTSKGADMKKLFRGIRATVLNDGELEKVEE
jgi:hypothetical protein